ncbi:uncharacterized protein LOC105210953 isoform X1 [Zeugodacus cucurbitae]|uniref:uncharacterized protein LOC105210953 isoform X1 n=1 Tax=Zeugodacus cucurbitae TaxID=28588 RepID=UPI0023D955D4|nr:uncharacterized protein LOC105210953 isoform X1 [Zeugodacus cucurbitae]XP_054089840.1 uncharacterized protein LOC105210953 isoform X1 [Zeugodacus cucurbitae]
MFKKSAKNEKNNSKEANNNALVRQDPRLKVRTATAHSETTNTTEKSATIFDNERGKVTHQTVRQTVTNQKTARITETLIRRTPTKEELEELLMTSGSFTNFTKPSSQWTKQETTVTQTNGRTQTSFVQHQKPTFPQPTTTTMGSGSSWKGITNSKPSSTLVVHADNYDPKSMLRALPPLTTSTPVTTSSLLNKPIRNTTSISSGSKITASKLGTSSSDNSIASKRAAFFNVKPTTTPTTSTSITSSSLLNKPIRATTTIGVSPLLSSYSCSQNGSGSKTTLPKLGSSSSDNNITSKKTSFYNAKPTTTITPLSNTATGYVSPYANRQYRSQDAVGYFSSTKPTNSASSTYLSTGLITTIPPTTKTLQQSSSSILPSKPPIPTLFQPQKSLSASEVKIKSNLNPGYAVIFNTVDFQDKERFGKRDGSDYDAKLLKETLEKYKLNVNTKKNPTVNNIKDTIKKLTTKNFSKYSCLVIVILSHGSANDLIAATDGVYNMNEVILYPILDIPTLKDKPKIFIIQACKGDLVPGEYKTDAYTTRGPPTEILKCYSTFEGYVSYRGETGSPFVQALCDEVKLKGDNTDIEQLMKNAIETVKTKTSSKQVPCMTTNLTKPFVFGHYV